MEDFDLSKVPAEEKFAEVEKFIAKIQDNFVAFGELLSNIKRTEAYKIKGYKTFKEFIEKEYNLAGAFATKLIDTYDLYMEEMDLSESDLKEIGFDRLNLIRPFVKDKAIDKAEQWIEEARNLNTPELREKVKEEKEKTKKQESMKDIFVKQYLEKMIAHFGCSLKELNFKLAVYFQDADLSSIKQIIKEKTKKLEIGE